MLIGNARVRPDTNRSCWEQDLTLMGLAEARPKAIGFCCAAKFKAILGPAGGKTQF